MTSGISIKLEGEFFRIGGREAERAIRDSVQEVVEVGEQRLDKILKPRPAGVYLSIQQAGKGQASTGHYRRNIHGEARGLRGEINDSNVVYGPWLEGTSSRNQTTRFKGYASFRKTRDRLQKEAPEIAEKHVRKAVRRMN